MADSKWNQVRIRLDEIRNWIIYEGATEKDIYTRLQISKNSWIKYKREYGILSSTIFEARKYKGQLLVPRLVQTLEKLAFGYQELDAEITENDVIDENHNLKIIKKRVHKKYPPSESAIWKLLKNYSRNLKEPFMDQPLDHILKEKKLKLEKEIQKFKEDNDF